jgi:hypothetical protein
MSKWLTSLVLLFTLAGQALGGVCGCLGDVPDVHSCCKREFGGKTSLAAKGCCSSDCESVSTQKSPRKGNWDVSAVEFAAKIRPALNYRHFPPVPAYASSPYRDFPSPKHRLKPPRPPDPLYLRHHSFLI